MDSKEIEDNLALFTERHQEHMLRVSLGHYNRLELDSVCSYELNALGLLDEIVPPTISQTTVNELLGNHQLNIPEGPFIFVREAQEANNVSVYTVDGLLLHSDQQVRNVVMGYFLKDQSTEGEWLTPRTYELLNEQKDDLASDEIEKWRTAGLKIIPVLRKDYFAYLAGLRQSMKADFNEGFDGYLNHVLRPEYEALKYLVPPTFSPSEQTNDLKELIEDLAQYESLNEALSVYLEKCGYIPLSSEYSIVKMVDHWLENNPGTSLNWPELLSWAETVETPVAIYHLLIMAQHFSKRIDEQYQGEVWRLLGEFLEVNHKTNLEENSFAAWWHLFCELSGHFVRHLEALEPGQKGERVACYGWWLADKVVRLLKSCEASPKSFLEKVVRSEQQLSYMRWLVARSQVQPCPFRYCSLYFNSTWQISLLVQISHVGISSDTIQVSDVLRNKIRDALHSFLIASPIANAAVEEPIYAFQENQQLKQFCTDVELPDALQLFIDFRQNNSVPENLSVTLKQLNEAQPELQKLSIFFLRETAFSSSQYDGAIESWLEQSDSVIHFMQSTDLDVLVLLLELLSEFQQRKQEEWGIRLPHILAYTLEQCEELARAKQIFNFVFFMAVNNGISSPLERVMESKWGAELHDELESMRQNMITIGKNSDPWVASRARAISSVVTKLIGPKKILKHIEVAAE